MPDDTVNVRYMVHDVDAAVDFYTKHFGFAVRTHAAPAFADVFRGRRSQCRELRSLDTRCRESCVVIDETACTTTLCQPTPKHDRRRSASWSRC
jgi:hypothetical protein